MAQRDRSRPGRSGNPAVRSGQRSPKAPDRTPTPPTPPPPDPGLLPVDGATYPQILRNQGYARWRSLAGAFIGVALFWLFVAVVSQVVVRIGWIITHPLNYRDYYIQAFAFQRPIGMLATNLGIATLIPIALVLMVALHQTRPRWLFSVGPGIRWRYLLVCLAVALIALNGVLALSTTVSGVPPVAVQQNFGAFLAVIVLTSPLQAAAEEIFFRGYLMQALGSVVARPWFGIVGSSVIFALLHGTQNLPLFVDRLAFGLLAALLVWRTGGLEAGIAAHVVNNVFAYLLAGLTTSIATLKTVRGIGWLDAGFDVGGFALFALLALGVARLMKLRHRVRLEPPVAVEPG